ncbi:MAG TPA: diacylglycerol kinase family protein [Trebonia sp.]|nr:diacylglycerol kinase family protein [Trebonia sp.]
MPAVAFVINGTLVRARGHFRDLCRAAARRAGWTAELIVTEKAGAGVTAARDAVDRGAGLVVAVGGDGTVRGCAEALAGTPVPLAIVPLGTANLLARTLGVPALPGAALTVALAPAPAGGTDRRIDLATADGEPFTAMAGMGLDAAVVAATKFKHHLGWLAYAMAGAAHLALRPATFTIRLDGGRPIVRPARSVVVGNSGLLPGGFVLLPDAAVDDGLLDVGILAPHGPLGWPRVAARVLTSSHVQDRNLERFQARTVEITTDATLPREIDGEAVAPGRALSVAVRRRVLTVRTPRSERSAGMAR